MRWISLATHYAISLKLLVRRRSMDKKSLSERFNDALFDLGDLHGLLEILYAVTPDDTRDAPPVKCVLLQACRKVKSVSAAFCELELEV
jgi:hypothetical protein